MKTTTYKMTLKSFLGSGLMFGQPVLTKKESNETHDAYEERTWQEKVPVDSSGNVFINRFALKNALETAGKFLGMKIPGEGKKTFTDRFRKGVIVPENLGLGIKVNSVEARKLFVPSDGTRGSGKRVFRIFPTVDSWETSCSLIVYDEKISREVLLEHLEAIGIYVGFGSMRVENGGENGRFQVSSLEIA
jgi:hypothetical protein